MRILLLIFILFWSVSDANSTAPSKKRSPLFNNYSFTLISYDYKQIVTFSEDDIKKLLDQKAKFPEMNDYINFIGSYFADRPYGNYILQGEGDWCDSTHRGCVHIQQDPIYRTDAFNCQTLVQVILALLQSNNLSEFNKNIIKINYGAIGTDKIDFYNRNNFVDPDWNRDNQKNKFIYNATSEGILKGYRKTTSTIINRQNWFLRFSLPKHVKSSIRVLDPKNGPEMAKLLKQEYNRQFHLFKPEKITLDYLPKTAIISKKIIKGKIVYTPNYTVINALPTPSVIEIVRDSSRWIYNRLPIQKAIGSNLTISHMGILYKQHFNDGQIIYQKITCTTRRSCTVKPVICKQNSGCDKIMFLHATVGYPKKYYYYSDNKNNYYCTRNKPTHNQAYSRCNRVMALPIEDYLMRKDKQDYLYLDTPSILGLHIEKIIQE